MIINHNLMAMNAHRQLSINSAAQTKSLEKLSSGYRINRAGDDAAGLAISEKMRGQIRGLNQASRNAQDGISLIQTAEGALNETHEILQRMRELVIQAGNTGTYHDNDLQKIQNEIEALQKELGGVADDDGKMTGISDRTEFNGKALLNGTVTTGFTFQIGANSGQQVSLAISSMSAGSLGVSSINVNSFATYSFDDQLDAIDQAIENVSTQRSALGAMQNRLEHTIKNVDNAAENLQAAESRIRDVDMAKEMMEYTKQSILSQAATAMLAQANQLPQNVLQLLR
ncbi:flagellin Hag [Pseudoclostridium thermosuccinogenes]|uniref:flagellin Hag n=1 Tax=Clostridium thermosuccinogenes TaxID=84032 RepID=UPI002FDB6146